MRPARASKGVVLPLPDGPRTPQTCPPRTAPEQSSRIVFCPFVLSGALNVRPFQRTSQLLGCSTSTRLSDMMNSGQCDRVSMSYEVRRRPAAACEEYRPECSAQFRLVGAYRWQTVAHRCCARCCYTYAKSVSVTGTAAAAGAFLLRAHEPSVGKALGNSRVRPLVLAP